MSPIRWTPRLDVGHAAIDHQHRHLADLLNRLEEAVLAGHGREVVSILVEEFERHTEIHFADEERLMDDHGYPHAESHKQEHRSMLDDIHRFCDQCVLAGSDPRSLIHHFEHWFVRHLDESDRPLGEALAGSSA